MPRENIERLVDPGSFNEYWPLVVARQHQHATPSKALRENTPGDGVVAGMCSINGDLFDATKSRAALVHYDYTVLAGTQGHRPTTTSRTASSNCANGSGCLWCCSAKAAAGGLGEDNIGPRGRHRYAYVHNVLAT